MASKINVTLGLDVSAFQKGLAQATAKLDAFAKRAQSMGSTLSQNVTLPLVGLGAAAVKSFVDIDKLERGMVAIMGSSEAAAAELTKLKEVAKLPGIGFKEAVQGSINLQAVGLSADEARSTIGGFAKALAATGKGRVELEAIQYQLTQMISKNKILAEDYKVIQSNLPLMAAGLERAFGTSNIEAVRATGISAKEFTMRLSEALNTLPQVEKATGGLGNAFDNFGDSIQFSLAELGRSIATSLNLEAVLSTLSDAVARVVDWFTQLSPGVQKAVVYFAAFAAGAGPVLFVIGKLAGAGVTLSEGFSTLKSAFLGMISPAGLVVAGLTAIAAVAYSVYANYKKLNPEIEDYSNFTSEATKNVIAEKAEFNALIDVLKDTNISSSTRKKIIDEINTKYSQYLPNLLSEKESLDDIKAAQDGANKSFADKIKLTALEGIVEKQKSRLVELAQDEYEIERKLAEQRKLVANQVPKITGANYVYGQSSAQNSVENLQQAASLRELEQRLTNTRKAQQALTDSFKKSESDLSKLIGGALVVPDATGTGKGKSTGTDTGVVTTYENKIVNVKPDINTSEYDKQLANLSSRLYDFANKMQKPFGFIRTALQETFDVAPQISAQKDALLEYEKSIAKIAERAALLGENPLDAYLKETESALVSALETFGPTSDAVRVLKEEYDRLNLSLATNKETFDAQQESIAKQKDLVADYMGVVSGAFDTAAQSLAESAVTIKAVLSAVGKAALKAASDFLRAKIIEAVAAFIADSFKKFGVLGAVIGAAGGAAVGALFTAAVGKISGIKLATGGLAFGPTLATVGDNPNAISDPEVIAPLSKLKDYLNGGGGYIAETRISGSDLLILVSNAERRNGRIR